MRLTSTLTLRELTPLEASTPELLPPELRGFQFPYLIPDWCFVAERNGLPVGLVVTSMVHGVLFIWRILATASSPLNLWLAALPAVLDTCRKRGCVGYGCFLHDDKPLEAKIGRILLKNGATLEPWVGSIAIAPMPKGKDA